MDLRGIANATTDTVNPNILVTVLASIWLYCRFWPQAGSLLRSAGHGICTGPGAYCCRSSSS